jgi:hypothetical protein
MIGINRDTKFRWSAWSRGQRVLSGELTLTNFAKKCRHLGKGTEVAKPEAIFSHYDFGLSDI